MEYYCAVMMNDLINAKKILAELKKGESDRKRVTLFLSESLYSQFRKACAGISASQVFEQLMKSFLESLSKKG